MLIAVLQMILPLIISFMIGRIFRFRNLIAQSGCNVLKSIMSRVLIPVTLFDGLIFATYSASTVSLILITAASIALSFGLALLFRRFAGDRKQYFPFAVTTWEGGILGVPLCAMIYGQAGASRMALMDFGHTVIVFLVILPFLKSVEGSKTGFKSILKAIFTTETFDAIILGALCGMSGLGTVIRNSNFYSVYTSIVSSITGSTIFFLMFTIGFEFTLKKDVMRDVSKALFFRFIVMGLSFAFALVLLSVFTEIDSRVLGIAIIAYTLPASFGFPTFGKFTGNEDYISSSISCGTIFSIICAVIVSVLLKA